MSYLERDAARYLGPHRCWGQPYDTAARVAVRRLGCGRHFYSLDNPPARGPAGEPAERELALAE